MWKSYRYTSLVEKADSDRSAEEGFERIQDQDQKRSSISWSSITYVLLATSFALNGLQWVMNHRGAGLREPSGVSRYTGLAFDTQVTYHAHTEYGNHNTSRADELWEAIDASPVAVALSKEYQKEHDLPPSSPFPWDTSKDLYFLKAFHHLHCLKLYRKALLNYEQGVEQNIAMSHIYHCLDGMRQDIMCKPDDTPMPLGSVKHTVGNGQVMECRNWDKLVEWSQDLERNACHKLISDYRPIKHSLELYQYCPKDSPFYPTMTAYFEKWGHKDPYVE